MIIKEYQPVGFVADSSICACNNKDSQPVQDGDVTEFQVKMEVCNFAQDLITNGDFDDGSGTGWTLNGFSITADEISSGDAGISTMETAVDVMGENISYQLEIDITRNAGAPLLIYFGTRKVAEISDTGKYQLSNVCTADDVTAPLRIISPGSNTTTIERIALYPLESDIGLVIMSVGADGSLTNVDFRSLADDVADANYTFFRVDRDVITVSFPWDYITDAVNGLNSTYGCFALGICGKCQNTSGQLGTFDKECVMPIYDLNGTLQLNFDTYPYYVDAIANSKVTVSGGIMTFLQESGTTETKVHDINFIPKSTMVYGYELELANIFNVEVDLMIGGTSVATFTTNGVKSGNVTAVDGTIFELKFTAISGGGDTVDVLYIRIDAFANKSVPADLPNLDPDFNSNVFDFKAAQPCSVLVAGANNEDAFEHRFESAQYTPKFRWKGSVRANDYNVEIEKNINAFGIDEINYFENRKFVSLRLTRVPEYLVDFLSILRGMSVIYVDSFEYVAVEDLDIVWNRFCDAGKIELIMGERRQELINENTKGLTFVSDINNTLVRVFDEQEPIIFLDGEEIALNG